MLPAILNDIHWGTLYLASEWVVRIAAFLYVPQRRPPSAARAWLLLIFFLPWPGVVLYLLIGRAYTPRRRLKVQRQIYELIRELAPRPERSRRVWPAWYPRARAGAAPRRQALRVSDGRGNRFILPLYDAALDTSLQTSNPRNAMCICSSTSSRTTTQVAAWPLRWTAPRVVASLSVCWPMQSARAPA
jgi:hypothetical protein